MVDLKQLEFEHRVSQYNKFDLDFEKFEDHEYWGNECLKGAYKETNTELCFDFFKLGKLQSGRSFFEERLKISAGNTEEDFSMTVGKYNDEFTSMLWYFFNDLKL